MNKKLNFSPEELTVNKNKKLLIGSVIPRPIALVSTMSNAGVVNVAPFSYFNIVTYEPPMLSIAVQRIRGEQKDTARNIMENKEAVVQVVDTDNVDATNKTSAPLEPHESELDISSFTTVESKVVKVPGVNKTKVRFETAVYDSTIIYNDDNIATTDVLFLRVKHYHIDETIYHNGYIDPLKLGVVSRLAGNDYAVFILLHGTGGTESDLVSLAELLNPAYNVLGIRGNVQENGMNRFFKRHSEGNYDWKDLDFRGKELFEFIVEKSKEYDFKLENVVLVGFSNGSNIATQMMLQQPDAFKRAALFAPMYPVDVAEKQDFSDVKVFLSLGKGDPFVPESESERVIRLFTDRDADVTTTWVNGHSLSQEVALEAKNWLNK